MERLIPDYYCDIDERGWSMNTKIIGAVAALGLLSAQAFAETSYETASVVESRAIYELVEISTPQEQCWEEEVVRYKRRHHHSDRGTPLLISTVIGGAIGNAVGHNKSSRKVGTVIGALLGHSIGRDIIRKKDSNYGEAQGKTYQTVQHPKFLLAQRDNLAMPTEQGPVYHLTTMYNTRRACRLGKIHGVNADWWCSVGKRNQDGVAKRTKHTVALIGRLGWVGSPLEGSV